MIQKILLCLLSAFLLILSLSGFNLWVFTWFGFVPLFFAVENKSKFKAFLLSYITGVIFWAGTIYWLIHVTLLGTILLVLYLALYFGIFGLFFNKIRNMRYGILLIPSLWVLLEYVRGHLFTGFPWTLLGYSQFLNLPVIQIADIFGVWGVSFIVMMANTAIYSLCVARRAPRVKIKEYVIFMLCVITVLGYGYYKIHVSRNTLHASRIKVSVIQGNIPQELKWDVLSRQYILDKYIRLTEKAAVLKLEGDGLASFKPDLIVWPEASAPGLLGEDNWGFENIFNLSKKIKIPLLVGSVVKDGKSFFNSVLLIDTNGKISQHYDKIHLVPFGEYIPFKRIFPFLEVVVPIGDIMAGKEYVVFRQSVKSDNCNWIAKFSVLICFEDLFPELSRQFVKKGVNFLINITNDAWYKETSASYQHLQASVFRAVENRVNVLRSANTGVSGFISPEGKIISLVADASGKEIFVDGYRTQSIVVLKSPRSFYTNYGDWFILFCFILVLGGIIIPWVRGVLLHR